MFDFINKNNIWGFVIAGVLALMLYHNASPKVKTDIHKGFLYTDLFRFALLIIG